MIVEIGFPRRRSVTLTLAASLSATFTLVNKYAGRDVTLFLEKLSVSTTSITTGWKELRAAKTSDSVRSLSERSTLTVFQFWPSIPAKIAPMLLRSLLEKLATLSGGGGSTGDDQWSVRGA